MARRSTVLFCTEEIFSDLHKFLNCGRDETIPLVPNKYSAYLALASSSTLRVSVPKFVVIPDCEIEKIIEVDFLHDDGNKSKDPLVYPEKQNTKFNLFDGQGLVSPERSKQWGAELQLDYTPSEFIIRDGFLKGLLVTFDFHELARRNNIETIKDVYGNQYPIESIDTIISVSQFKMYQSYKSTEEYIEKCKELDYSFGISRCSIKPSSEKGHCFSTYQYLQNLNIQTKEQVEGLCKKTVDWFNNVTGNDWIYTTLFLMGDIDKSRIGEDWFNKLDNPLLQSLLLEPKLINDKQIQNKIQRLINKKIKESYLGVLLLNGNYQFLVSDPFAQAEWALGLQTKGILSDGESFCQFWNEKNISKVCAIRSPMTWRSESNLLNIKNNEDLKYWYKYLDTGIVFNIYGIDALKMSNCDFDGDILLTTDQKEFLECAYAEKDFLPPMYNRKTAEKKIIVESELWEYDIKTFKGRIGLYTNFGTEFFAMLSQFEEGSEEYNEILNRLKICNCLQSMEIDRAKGIQTMDVPKYWTKWEKITGDETPEELHLKELHHRTICDKRPYFFRYLYPNYEKEYKERLDTYNNYCESKFDGDLNHIINKENKNEEESRIVSNYYRFGTLLDSDCVMNKICHYMESQVKELKKNNQLKSFDFKSLVDNNIEYKEKNKVVLENLYQKYRQFKQQINYKSSSSGFQEMMKWLREQSDSIVTSSDEIVYWGSEFGSSFLLDVFGDDLVEVLKEYSNRKFIMPVKSNDGYIDYMGSKYEIVRVDLWHLIEK